MQTLFISDIQTASFARRTGSKDKKKRRITLGSGASEVRRGISTANRTSQEIRGWANSLKRWGVW